MKDVKVYIGQWRTALLRAAPFPPDANLKMVLSVLEPEVKQVVDTTSFNHKDILAALSDRIRIRQLNKESLADSMRAIKSSQG